MKRLHDAVAPTLTSKHPFQLGYTTTDLAAAIETYGRVFNAPDFLVREPAVVEMRTPDGVICPQLRLAFAWVGDVTVELIQPMGGDDAIYRAGLPDEGYALRLHHLGYLVDGEIDNWDRFRAQVPDDLLLFEGAVGDHTRFLYLDTLADVGHYTEYLWWSPDRRAWLDTIPGNS